MKKLWILPVLIFILTSCTAPQPVKKTAFLLDTYITITLYDASDSTIIDKTMDFIKQYDALWNRNNPNSDISRLNSSTGFCDVDPQTKQIIELSLTYCELTGGLFDITTAPLSDLWNIKERTEPPAEAEIAAARQKVDYHAVRFQGNQVSVYPAKVDLGAIAKGYIADRTKDFLLENGVNRAVIDLGGNIYAIGEKESGKPFQIGIQKPFSQDIIKTVSLSSSSAVTAGAYQRYFEKDGVVYHHIINPETGYPADTDLVSATVISDNSTQNDALSTVCILLGYDKSIDFLSSYYPTVSVFFVCKDGNTKTFGQLPQ